MEIKGTIVGLLIYVTMAAYVVAAGAFIARRPKVGNVAFFGGFVAALAAFVYRWIDVDHVPLQNLFEVFLCLGMLIFPLSFLSRRYLRVGGEAADAIVGFITLFPAGFVFSAEPQQLPPALQSVLFVPHVAAYMISYMVMAKAAVQAGRHLLGRGSGDAKGRLLPPEAAAYEMVRLGFPLLTVGLVLGAVWGKIAWGDYWNWDPKELWSLVSWLLFLEYLHFRYLYGKRFPRVASTLVVSGMAAIICTLLWVNLGRIFSGLHSYAS